jgi:hypothetical protein
VGNNYSLFNETTLEGGILSQLVPPPFSREGDRGRVENKAYKGACKNIKAA